MIAILLAAALVAVPLAGASAHKRDDAGAKDSQKPRQNQNQDRDPDRRHGGDNATHEGANETQEARAQRQAELREAQRAAKDEFREERAGLVQAYHARLREIRESFLENKTRVIDECRNGTREAPAAGYGYGYTGGASRNDTLTFAHCVRDGLKPLKEEARASMKEAHEDTKASLKSLAKKKAEEFRAKKAAMRGKQAEQGGS